MFELTEVGIIQKLVANYDSAFPNASYLCLGILAFYSSFLRVNFCKDQVLRFSQVLLDKLQAWSKRTDVSQEERELARRLHEDFGRFEPATMPPQQQQQESKGEWVASSWQMGGLMADCNSRSNSSADSSAAQDTDAEDEFMLFEVKETFDRTSVNHVSDEASKGTGTKAQDAWKKRGNDAYKNKDWNQAVACYSRALDVPVTEEELLTEGPRRAVLHSNRAAAYLARSRASGNFEFEDDEFGHLAGCEMASAEGGERAKMNCKAAAMDCDQALDLQVGGTPRRRAEELGVEELLTWRLLSLSLSLSVPQSGMVKARYRKAQALEGLGRRDQALEAAKSALNAAPAAMEREISALVKRLEAAALAAGKKEEEQEAASVVAPAGKGKASLADEDIGPGAGGLLGSIMGGEDRWAGLGDASVGTGGASTEHKAPLIEVISSEDS